MMVQGIFDRPSTFLGWLHWSLGWIVFLLFGLVTAPGLMYFNGLMMVRGSGTVHIVVYFVLFYGLIPWWGLSLLVSIGLARLQAKGWLMLPFLYCSINDIKFKGQKSRKGQKRQGYSTFKFKAKEESQDKKKTTGRHLPRSKAR